MEDILQRPTLFHKRWVRLRGRIVEVRFSPARRGRSAVITILYLSDRVGNTIEVAIEEDVPLREGQEVTVEGRAMLLPATSSRSADVVITAAHVVTSLDKDSATVTAPKKSPQKTAPPKGSIPRKSESAPEDEEGRIF